MSNLAAASQVPPNVGLKAWRNSVMVFFALGGLAVSTWGPRLPDLRDALGLGDGSIGLALAAVTIGSLVGLASSPALLSRLGNRRAILATIFLIAAGVALLGIGAGALYSAASAALGFGLIGFGVGALDIVMNVEGAAVETAAKKTLLPLMHACWSAGAVAGASIGAASAVLAMNFASQFVGEAIVIAVAGYVGTRFLPMSSFPSLADPAPIGLRVRQWLSGWKSRQLLLIGLVMFAVELGEGAANSWLTLAAHDGHSQRPSIAALLFLAFAIGETAARVGGGPLVDRLGRRLTIRLTTAFGVIGLILFITTDSTWAILAGTLLWALGVSMGFPLGMSAAAATGGDDAATRVSVVASFGAVANLSGPPIIGALSDNLGILNSLWLPAAFLAIGCATAGTFARKSTS